MELTPSTHQPEDHHDLEAWVDHLYEMSDAEVCRILSAYIERLRAKQNDSSDSAD